MSAFNHYNKIIFNNNDRPISVIYDPDDKKIIAAYRNNEGHGVVIVGTITNDTIEFSKPAIFNEGDTQYISIAYDHINNKVIIAYEDVINMRTGYSRAIAIVADINGADILFGDPVVFNADITYSISALYDYIDQKVVIIYSDYNNKLYDNTAIVGTIDHNNNSIIFGTPVVFHSDGFLNISAAYDYFNNKIIIAYTSKDNDYNKKNAWRGLIHNDLWHGMAIVGAVDADNNSILFGNPVIFSDRDIGGLSIGYSALNNKVIIIYTDNNNSAHGTAIVGTINADNNSISFGNPEIFNSKPTKNLSTIYNFDDGKILIGYYNYNSQYYGKTKVATIIDTSVKFSKRTMFDDTNVANIAATMAQLITK